MAKTKTIVDFENTDFAGEINELFHSHAFNFGPGATPIEVTSEAVLKCVCGWYNGSTAKYVTLALGYVKELKKGGYKLTPKGKAFMWWRFESGREKPKRIDTIPPAMQSLRNSIERHQRRPDRVDKSLDWIVNR